MVWEEKENQNVAKCAQQLVTQSSSEAKKFWPTTMFYHLKRKNFVSEQNYWNKLRKLLVEL